MDIYRDPSRPDTYYVGKIEKGEWLQYTVNIQEEGKYRLEFDVSAKTDGGMLSIKDEERNILSMKIPSTGSSEKWLKITTANISLVQGIHRLRIYAETGGFNLESIRFLKQ